MTDEHVIEAVESLVGIGSGAWDTVNPMDLLGAFRAVLPQGKQQAEGARQDCTFCNGRGFYGIPGQRCSLCDGTGKDRLSPVERSQPVGAALTDEQILAGVEEFADEVMFRYHKEDILRCVRAILALSPVAASAPAGERPTDTERFDWLMHRISGSELRRLGIQKASGGAHWTRIAIDIAMSGSAQSKGDGNV